MKSNLILFFFVATQLIFSVQAQTATDASKSAVIGQNAGLGVNSIVGLPADLSALEANGVFVFDALSATSVLYHVIDMKNVLGSGQNLLDYSLDYAQFLNQEKQRLISERRKCSEIREEFPKRDCLNNLINIFAAYGKKVNGAKFISIPEDGLKEWDENRKQLILKNIRPKVSATNQSCQKNSICLKTGSYGAGDFLICYQMNTALPVNLSIPMDESTARGLSGRLEGNMSYGSLTYLLQVTEIPKPLPTPRMCTDRSSGKIVAEGRAIPNYAVLWSRIRAEYAHDFQSDQKSASVIPAFGKIAPLVPVYVAPGQTPAVLPGKVILKVN